MSDLLSQGVTPSERYLNKLAKRSFLSLWCYPNVFTDESRVNGKGPAKELCDLLIVFGKDVLIFSDKYVKFNKDKVIPVAWKRWYNKAIDKSAGQLFKAERWLKEHPDRIFLDNLCTKKFPLEIPNKSQMRVHKICVANGALLACQKFFNNQSLGSLILDMGIDGKEGHDFPFTIGHSCRVRGFIHVFDELTLQNIFNEIDTISDFVKYLVKRQIFLSQNKPCIHVAGEEQILAIYLKNINENGEHDFVLPNMKGQITDRLYLDESFWNSLRENPQYIAKKRADEISYIWDELIEHFIRNHDKNYQGQDPSLNFSQLEYGLRFMAAEDRLRRRQLGESLFEMLKTCPKDRQLARLVYSNMKPEIIYMFLIVPKPEDISYVEYRNFRKSLLAANCTVSKLKRPEAHYIIGITTEPSGTNGASEDLLFMDVREWTDDMQKAAVETQAEFSILLDKNIKSFEGITDEYPEVRDVENRKMIVMRNEDKKRKNLRNMRKVSKRRNRKK
ncbi:MAG: hypothetical protein PHR06_05330 [Candidatus Cloacimonetes bacterium]|nr:hypothetical protein [Candidatus Cloacimonadota bacterium]